LHGSLRAELIRTYAKIGFTLSPLAGEGWGEGAMGLAKTKTYANVSTLSPALPRQGGERSEGAELNPLAA